MSRRASFCAWAKRRIWVWRIDVGDDLVGQAVHQGLDFVGTEAEGGRRPVVDFFDRSRTAAVASCADVFQDGFDGLTDLAVRLGLLGFGGALL